jgi:phosphoribosylaminoimidazole-succinocarboxamide synthase
MGEAKTAQVEKLALSIYQFAADYALPRGIIIADTKMEFGEDENGVIHLIDEVLTPDSSRFWPADQYAVGCNPPSFDKQYIRDYLETLDWGKVAPGPELPANVVEQTLAKYQEAERLLTT